MSRLTCLRWVTFDIAVAVLLAAISVEEHLDDAARWWPFALLMMVGLVLARHQPLAAVVLASVGALGHHLPEPVGVEALDLAVPVTLFALAAIGRSRRAGAVVCGLMLAAVAAMSLLQKQSVDQIVPSPDTRLMAVPEEGLLRMPASDERLWIGRPAETGVADRLWLTSGLFLALSAAWLLGDNLRGRRLHLATLERRAADLEREQRQRVALATAAERARITRELHDVVAHGLSVMVIQAQGAAAALRRHPDRSEAALQHVISTGRTSLAEMRRLLVIVRAEPGLAPQPGVDGLPALIDDIRATGTVVGFTVTGDPVPLPAVVDLSAYRITQEALTNTLKHAGPGAGADVRLTYRPTELEIAVTDDGPCSPVPSPSDGSGHPASSPGDGSSRPAAAADDRSGSPASLAGDGPGCVAQVTGGNGLRGITERVRLLGGTLTTGPVPAGGFLVRAVLPLSPEESR